MESASTELKQLRLIGEIVSRINLGKSFGDILDAVYTHLVEILPCNRIAVGLVEADGTRITLAAVRADGPIVLAVGAQMPLGGTNLEGLIRRNETLLVNDLEDYVRTHPRSGTNRQVLAEGMRAAMTVPLIAGGGAVGVLFLSSRRRGAFETRHAEFVRQIAGHLAMSIEKSRLISMLEARNLALAESKALSERYVVQLESDVMRKTRELELSRERYRTLLAISNTINESVEFDAVFDRIVEALQQVFPVDRLAIVLCEAESNQARLYSLSPRGERPGPESDNIPLDRSLTGQALRADRTMYWPDLSALPETFESNLLAFGVRSFVAVPLKQKERTLGAMNISSRKSGCFSPDDLSFLDQVAEPVTLALRNALAFAEIERLKTRLEKENVTLRQELTARDAMQKIVGVSRSLEEVRAAVRRVGPTDATVLIRGETGTGKELVARALHQASRRRDRVLVTVNCAALPESLIESELFGHERGAFTGAVDRRLGRFELAMGGTIFLDEIGDLPLGTQVKLLRVLQERQFERVGGRTTLTVDVRVIAATNRSLEAAMTEGSFRADLYYRLNVFPVVVPPLRERVDDIPELAMHFLEHYAHKTGRTFLGVHPATMQRLLDYHWPGNVRELENVIERAVILGDGPDLRVDEGLLGAGSRGPKYRQITLAEMERRYIAEVLDATSGVIYGPHGAAALLGVKPSTLQSRMKRLGVTRPVKGPRAAKPAV
ncbi:MAG: sigma 54-interacting transcriptional regulator [Planctomycetes bacterium]|nr:sigma 54-interacting transcriptional regulator [Planctomycetota bacterium]